MHINIKPLLKHLNKKCLRTVENSAGLCLSKTNYEVTIEHILFIFCEESSSDLQNILRYFDINPSRFQAYLKETIDDLRTGNTGKPVFSPILIEWFQDAWLLTSLDFNLSEIRSGTLLAAVVRNPGRYCPENLRELLECISFEKLHRNFHEIVSGSTEGSQDVKNSQSFSESDRFQQGSALSRFTISYTEQARSGKIDPVFGRDAEIRQMIDILARRRKNNPIVVGEAGVGKTALIEGLSLRVINEDVPSILKNVEILGLDLGLLQAGAGVRGEFENRLKSVINEVKSSPVSIILFIDEAHVLIGSGGAVGGSDAANLLKPALARGELRTIAATTWSEYKKYFEKDSALVRRFQVVKLDEPSENDAIVMLGGLKEKYEEAHCVKISDSGIEAAVRLSARYISGRQLPDKAVDLLDTSASRVKIGLSSKPASLDDAIRKLDHLERKLSVQEDDRESGLDVDENCLTTLREQIQLVQLEKESIEKQWLNEKRIIERIIDLRKRIKIAKDQKVSENRSSGQNIETENGTERQFADEGHENQDSLKIALKQALENLEKIQGDSPLVFPEVGPEIISQVVSEWTGIPMGRILRDEARAILNIEESLGKRIKSQPHAVEAVANGIRASKSGIAAPRSPIGVFLFTGPSGVGKTECAMAVADLLFGGDRFMVTVNMSEFQEKHSVSRLIGSPPGYVGYGEGGVLTEAVRQRPYSVVLLDEVEKADPEVLNLFYQVFDKGMLADGEGRVVDFKNTVIFLTSNLASDIITNALTVTPALSSKKMIDMIRPILNRHFKPALLARMTIVPFYPIGQEAMKEIADLKLRNLAERLQNNNKMTLDYSPQVLDQILQRCTEVETGARNIDHIIRDNLLPKISIQILQRTAEKKRPDKLKIGIGEYGDFTFEFDV
ncbi:MAG: type VI secretion system ATPase TssH [Desulfamplus sp.]|nr:type VI secretion system ATPase TssH [Desulfamplus sp.]